MFQGRYNFQVGDEGEVSSFIEWFGVHPGNEIDSLLKNYTLGLYNSNMSQTEILIIPDYYIFLYWNVSLMHGYINVLQASGASEEFVSWGNCLWQILNNSNMSWEGLMEFIRSDTTSEDCSVEISSDLLKQTYPQQNNPVNSHEYYSLQSFCNLLWNIIAIRPWNFLYLQSILIKQEMKHIEMQYTNDLSSIFPFDALMSLEKQILNGSNDALFLIQQATYVCIRYFFEERFKKFTNYAELLSLYFNTKDDLQGQIQLFSSHLVSLMEINQEFFANAISHLLQDIATHQLFDDHLVGKLLSLSQSLYAGEFFDLAKLCEGTAFEKTLMVKDPVLKKEFLSKLMESNLQWGEEAVIGLLNVVSGFLGDGEVEVETFNSLLDQSIPLLERTKSGLVALIELLVLVGRIDEAVQYRFKMTEEIVNDELMAMEIFKAILWMIDKERINETVLSKILQTYLPRALEKVAPGETFLRQIRYIYEDISKRDLDGLLVKVTSVIIKNMKKIALLDRFDALQIINENLSKKEKFKDLIIEINTRMFSVALEEGLDKEAEKLYDRTIKLLDKEGAFFYENFFRFCKRAVISSAKYGYESYLNRTIQMMMSELNTPELRKKYKTRIFELMREAIKETERVPPTDTMHPGIRLYNLVLSLSHDFEAPDLLKDFIHDAPLFAYRKKDFKNYAHFSILLIKSLYLEKDDWIGAFTIAVNSLVSVSEFDHVKTLFEEIEQLEMPLNYREQIINKKLEIVESQNSTFLAPEEVIVLRKELIELTKERRDNPEITLLQYQKGFDELIANGLIDEGIDMLLKGIEYCIEVEQPSIELVEILKDIFSKQLNDAKNNIVKVRSLVVKVIRGLNNATNGAPLTVLPFVILGIQKLVRHKDRSTARFVALEALPQITLRMEEMDYHGDREIHSVIESIAHLYRASQSDINAQILHFKVKYELYTAARQEKMIISSLSKTLHQLKKPAFALKHGTPSLIASIFIISQVYNNAIRTFHDDVIKRLHVEIINYFSSLEHVLTDGTPFSDLMQTIIRDLQENPQGTLLNLIFQIKALVEAYDTSYL